MNIRKATQADLDAIESIYNEVLDDQEQNQNTTNWQRGKYPTRATAEKALRSETLYLQFDDNGKAVGTAILNHEQLPEYSKISWEYPGEGEQVFVIHTLCIAPSAAGHGYARQFVDFAEQLGREKGCTTLRLDTYEGNLPARAMYLKLGYRYAGETEFFFQGFIHEILVLFEKKL